MAKTCVEDLVGGFFIERHGNYHLHRLTDRGLGAFALGRYRHYTGNEYEAFAIAVDVNTRELTVLYRSIEPKFNHTLFTRPMREFCKSVDVDGEQRPRFSYLGAIDESR